MKLKKSLSILFVSVIAASFNLVDAQIPDQPDANIAGIPVNYTESKVVNFNLPDVLTTFNGKAVADVKTWNEVRRPELLNYIETEYYGRVPDTAPEVFWVVDSTDTQAFGGKAIKKRLSGHMGTPDGPAIDVTLYTPTDANGPAPVLAHLSFNFGGRRPPAAANESPTPAVRPGSPEFLINHGYGYAFINYSSIESDRQGEVNVNLARKLALADGQEVPSPDEWGTIASWAWGVNRLMDYFETDPAVDEKRIALTGTSRLGKTVTWAGAKDQRIALVIACSGGEGGAALARRNYGETIAHLVAPTRYPYQFAGNYQKYAPDPSLSKVDTHSLVALMAPRPILLSTGIQDGWSDPYGEFLAAKAATPVYELFGEKGIEDDKYTEVGEMVGNELSFLMTTGGHGSTDWDLWIKFMDKYLKK